MQIHKDNRSLSPHLYVYKPQITSVVSIFHRITGSLLAIIFLCTSIIVNLLGSFLSFNLFYSLFVIIPAPPFDPDKSATELSESERMEYFGAVSDIVVYASKYLFNSSVSKG